MPPQPSLTPARRRPRPPVARRRSHGRFGETTGARRFGVGKVGGGQRLRQCGRLRRLARHPVRPIGCRLHQDIVQLASTSGQDISRDHPMGRAYGHHPAPQPLQTGGRAHARGRRPTRKPWRASSSPLCLLFSLPQEALRSASSTPASCSTPTRTGHIPGSQAMSRSASTTTIHSSRATGDRYEPGYLADADGHGTFVTGLILHEAPAAQIIMCGVLDKPANGDAQRARGLDSRDDPAVAEAVRPTRGQPRCSGHQPLVRGGVFEDERQCPRASRGASRPS